MRVCSFSVFLQKKKHFFFLKADEKLPGHVKQKHGRALLHSEMTCRESLSAHALQVNRQEGGRGLCATRFYV